MFWSFSCKTKWFQQTWFFIVVVSYGWNPWNWIASLSYGTCGFVVTTCIECDGPTFRFCSCMSTFISISWMSHRKCPLLLVPASNGLLGTKLLQLQVLWIILVDIVRYLYYSWHSFCYLFLAPFDQMFISCLLIWLYLCMGNYLLTFHNMSLLSWWRCTSSFHLSYFLVPHKHFS